MEDRNKALEEEGRTLKSCVKSVDKMQWQIETLEKESIKQKDEITKVEWGQKKEIEKVLESISKFGEELHKLNINIAKMTVKFNTEE